MYVNFNTYLKSFGDKKIEESLNTYKYTEIVVKVNNREDLEKLIKFYSTFMIINNSDSLMNISKEYRFPNYIFLNLDQFTTHNNCTYLSFLSDRPNSENFRSCITDRETVDKHIYQMNELTKVESIVKYGNPDYIPSYKPKRIERTLESIDNKPYPYRFKTKEEFIKEFGERNWIRGGYSQGTSFSEDMDYLLGQEYPYNINIDLKDKNINVFSSIPRLININRLVGIHQWCILPFMLTHNTKNEPTYKPKKIERTL